MGGRAPGKEDAGAAGGGPRSDGDVSEEGLAARGER